MKDESALPADVIAEIKANHKIAAIKLLREHEGIDLKEAKERVDAYVEMHPSSTRAQLPKSDTGIGRIIILIIGVSVIYTIYKLLV